MYYINPTPTNHGNPMGQPFPDCVALPDELLSAYLDTMGFCTLTVEEGAVTALVVDQEALDAYNASAQPDIDTLRTAKLAEISDACHAAIVAGVDVALSDGTTGHFSLEETDQINLTTAYNAVQTGATGYPYHADGELCKMYSAADITAISVAATAHKLYQLTYCNHLLAWAKRAETADEMAGITYGADLPEDLAANMAEVLANASTTA